MEKGRLSNFELLRIVAMYMIVLIHVNIHLDIIWDVFAGSIYNPIINGICNTGVSLFILTSGYFGVSFNIKKITKLECKMITYSLVVFVVSLLFYGTQLSGGDKLELLAKSLLPFISRNHWFYSCYILIILFSGYISRFIEILDKKSFRMLLGIMIICFSIFPTLFYFEVVPDNGKGIVQMFMVYMIGRYIRLYADDYGKEHKAAMVICFLAMWTINAISFSKPITVGGIYHTLTKDNSISNLILAVSLFYIFKDLKLKSSIINSFAKYIFAVFAMNYIIGEMLFEHFSNVLPDWARVGIPGIMVMMGSAFLILLGCILVGIVRDFLLGWADEKIATRIELIAAQIDRKL